MTKKERVTKVVHGIVAAFKAHGRDVTRNEVADTAGCSRQSIGRYIGTKFPEIEITARPVGPQSTAAWSYLPSAELVRLVEAGEYEVPASMLPKGKPRRVGDGWGKGRLRHTPEDIDLSTIGGRLRSCRVGANMTQGAWAAFIGCNLNTVGKLEAENSLPASRHLRVYAENGYNVNWIITGKGDRRITS